MLTSIDDLLGHIQQLVPPGEAEALQGSVATDFDVDSEALVKTLTEQQKLTDYQAEKLLAGQGDRLVMGNYLILDKVGAGGMGQVLKARHRRMNRVVALKMLPESMTASEKAHQRFHREWEAAARLEHPNVVTAHDADESHGVHFLVMQYVEGRDLAAHVKHGGPLSVAQAVECILQAAEGLRYAHGEGVIHRDVKPSNLLLGRDGRVRILDLGLARLDHASDGDELTRTGAVMGSIDYMAPEQAEDTKQADGRSDVYSLGCTLHFLLTGSPAYPGEAAVEKLLAHQRRPIPLLRSVRGDVPEGLDAALQKMLAKNPADRYADMAEVIDDVQRVQAGLPDGRGLEILNGFAAELEGPSFDSRRRSTATARPHVAVKEEASAAGLFDVVPTPAARSTVQSSVAELHLRRQRSQSATRRTLLISGGVAAGVVLLIVGFVWLLGIVLRVETPEGTVLVEIDGAGKPIEINVSEDKTITITDPNDGKPISVTVDRQKKQLVLEKQGFRVETLRFSLESPDGQKLSITFVPLEEAGPDPRPNDLPPDDPPEDPPPEELPPEDLPPVPDPPPADLPAPRPDPFHGWREDAPAPAVAPLKDGEAAQLQQAWADHLGLPVEREVDLPDGVKLTLVLIPPGEFNMGSTREEIIRFTEESNLIPDIHGATRISKEGPQHLVRITRPFYLGKYEVTQAQWQAIMGNNPSRVQDAPTHPVTQVSWDNIQGFLTKLNEATADETLRFALPTEAQWEFATRAGTTLPWHLGPSDRDLLAYGWFTLNSRGLTYPVGGKKPNPFGLYDVYGNVWEWCADGFTDDYYATSPVNDPPGAADPLTRVVRGGSYDRHPLVCRSATRTALSPDRRFGGIGFRLAADLPPISQAAPEVAPAPANEGE